MLLARIGALLAVMCLAAAPARASVITLPAGGSITFGDDLIQCSGGPVVDNCSDININGAVGLIKGCIAAGYGATYCIQQTNQQSNRRSGASPSPSSASSSARPQATRSRAARRPARPSDGQPFQLTALQALPVCVRSLNSVGLFVQSSPTSRM